MGRTLRLFDFTYYADRRIYFPPLHTNTYQFHWISTSIVIQIHSSKPIPFSRFICLYNCNLYVITPRFPNNLHHIFYTDIYLSYSSKSSFSRITTHGRETSKMSLLLISILNYGILNMGNTYNIVLTLGTFTYSSSQNIKRRSSSPQLSIQKVVLM